MSEQVTDSKQVSAPKRPSQRLEGERLKEANAERKRVRGPGKRTKQFDERFERYAKRYGSPVKLMFRIMADEAQAPELRVKCASELIRMRYPVKKAVEIQGQVENTITLRDMRTPAGQGTTIDVTPAAQAIALDELGDDEDDALEHLENDE